MFDSPEATQIWAATFLFFLFFLYPPVQSLLSFTLFLFLLLLFFSPLSTQAEETLDKGNVEAIDDEMLGRQPATWPLCSPITRHGVSLVAVDSKVSWAVNSLNLTTNDSSRSTVTRGKTWIVLQDAL